MICRYCTKEIMDGSIFCSFCGERVARKKKAKKAEIKVPKPRQLKSGAWNIELCNLRLEHRDAAVRGTVVNSLLCVDCGLICNDLVDLVVERIEHFDHFSLRVKFRRQDRVISLRRGQLHGEIKRFFRHAVVAAEKTAEEITPVPAEER